METPPFRRLNFSLWNCNPGPALRQYSSDKSRSIWLISGLVEQTIVFCGLPLLLDTLPADDKNPTVDPTASENFRILQRRRADRVVYGGGGEARSGFTLFAVSALSAPIIRTNLLTEINRNRTH